MSNDVRTFWFKVTISRMLIVPLRRAEQETKSKKSKRKNADALPATKSDNADSGIVYTDRTMIVHQVGATEQAAREAVEQTYREINPCNWDVRAEPITKTEQAEFNQMLHELSQLKLR